MLPALWHRYIFLFGIIGLACGMLFGTVPTSIPQIILAANWLLEKNFSDKLRQLKSNRIFLILTTLFILHVIGIIYTENMQQGLNELRNKLPLLTLPIILFSTIPLSKKEFRLLFHFYLLSILVSTVCCYLVYAGYTKKTVIDVRNASVFMSHIRFSLYVAFAVTALIYFIVKEKKILLRLMYTLLIGWLLFVMFKLQMVTGFLCLLIAGGILIFVLSIKHLKKTVAFALSISMLILLGLGLNSALSSLNMFEAEISSGANKLLKTSKSGRILFHDTLSKIAENGNLVFININVYELENTWNQRSKIKFDEFDRKGNEIKFTSLRYLASKGLTKDSAGVASLSDEDVTAIQNGTSNYKYSINKGLLSRWRGLVWEYTKYKRGENPSGHTLMMRLEFWKIASYIIHDHPVFGVGTGDVQDAFNEMYVRTNSKLDAVWRLRCHNQYLAITVAFGIIGAAIFLFYLFYPAILLRKKIHFLYWPFFIIAILSFLTEDTLETQAGVTFFIFFQCLFLWPASFRENDSATESTSHSA
ncbi:MAG: Lipid core - O-antigen ligase [Bacteroidota bacterium]|jgi:O-antigen ligase|nr:Lipid core - O-antigen ligase [Bacteroidota bacterium]